jgi:hypothetical protein
MEISGGGRGWGELLIVRKMAFWYKKLYINKRVRQLVIVTIFQ